MMQRKRDFHPDHIRRRLLGGMAAAPLLAAVAGCSPASEPHTETTRAAEPVPPPPGEKPLNNHQLADAIRLLDEEISIDLHSHPGAFFFNGMGVPEDPAVAAMASGAGFEERTMADMAAGGLTASVFSTVADALLIGAGPGGLFARREFEPGEAWADHLRQLALLTSRIEQGLMVPIRQPEDLATAKRSGTAGAILGTEGADFLEGALERVEQAHADGIRVMGLVHYHINELGDIQTAPPAHNGLTAFGKDVVREMNRLGMLADLAHATFQTTRDAAEASAAPIMISHSFLADEEARHPRLLTPDHARLVADTGGIIGGWPSGIAATRFETFVDRLFRLVDLVGIDHVGLGTDMDANFRPVLNSYRQLPYLPHALLARGMTREEVVKLLGGNFLRVFRAVSAAAGSSA